MPPPAGPCILWRRFARVQDAPREKNTQKLGRRQGKAPRQRTHAGFAAAEPPPRHGSRQRPRQFEPHGQGLKGQAAGQRPHARSQQIGGRAADDQRQPERRCPAVDLPGPQHRPGEGRSPLPCQRRPPRPRRQQGFQVQDRGMYIFFCIGKDCHKIGSPFMLYAVR